jgi:biotin transporter BioY
MMNGVGHEAGALSGQPAVVPTSPAAGFILGVLASGWVIGLFFNQWPARREL